jgi:hypothetical protein
VGVGVGVGRGGSGGGGWMWVVRGGGDETAPGAAAWLGPRGLLQVRGCWREGDAAGVVVVGGGVQRVCVWGGVRHGEDTGGVQGREVIADSRCVGVWPHCCSSTGCTCICVVPRTSPRFLCCVTHPPRPRPHTRRLTFACPLPPTWGIPPPAIPLPTTHTSPVILRTQAKLASLAAEAQVAQAAATSSFKWVLLCPATTPLLANCPTPHPTHNKLACPPPPPRAPLLYQAKLASLAAEAQVAQAAATSSFEWRGLRCGLALERLRVPLHAAKELAAGIGSSMDTGAYSVCVCVCALCVCTVCVHCVCAHLFWQVPKVCLGGRGGGAPACSQGAGCWHWQQHGHRWGAVLGAGPEPRGWWCAGGEGRGGGPLAGARASTRIHALLRAVCVRAVCTGCCVAWGPH